MASFPLFTETYHHKTYPTIDPTLPANSVEGKVVLITGGGKGIGRATAFSFAKAHAKAIIILGRTERTLKDTSDALRSCSSSLQVKHFVADATDYDRVNEIFRSVKEEFGALDIVVDNKGYLPELAPAKSADVNEWFKAFEINVKGSFIVTQSFINNASTGATLISTNTGAVSFYIPNHTAYGASKIALLRVLEDAQVEHPDLRFINLHPGVIETDMSTKSGFGVQDEENLPADFTVWLAQPAADFLKGRMVWANWDVNDLQSKSQEIREKDLLKSGVRGYPGF